MSEFDEFARHPVLRGIPEAKLRKYSAADSCVFWYTSAENGEFSNMADGFPIEILGRKFGSTEALYQASRFPDLPDLQEEICAARSPKAAKLIARSHMNKSRADWLDVRVEIMRWVLRLKASQHKKDFLFSLSQTGDRPVVEETTKDGFWGAVRIDDLLVGVNSLGRLLMELRDESRRDAFDLMNVPPPEISNALLFGKLVGRVSPKLG